MTDVARSPRAGKARCVRALQRRFVNPLTRAVVSLGVLPTHLVLETTGRRSGRPRQVPVGYARDGDTVRVVAEHGRRADYVRNIEADPRVRVRLGRRWRTGTAHLEHDSDPRQWLRDSGRPLNAAMVRLLGTDLLSVRIDLDQEGHP